MASIDELVRKVRSEAGQAPKVSPDALVSSGQERHFFDFRMLFLEDDNHFVDACYQQLLGRPADDSGRTVYQAVADKQGKLAVIMALLFSDECRTRFPDMQYGKVLHYWKRFIDLSKKIERYGIKINAPALLKRYSTYCERDLNILRFILKTTQAENTLLRGQIAQANSKLQVLFELKKSQLQMNEQLHSHAGKFADLQAAVHGMPSLVAGGAERTDPETEAALDRYYKAFEDANRGSQAEIRAKQQPYTAFLTALKDRVANRRAVDIGCGRGEWLQLLEEEGFEAVGVDMNATMVACCKEKGLVAVEQDALSYLKQKPADSMALLSGFHIIEHLPFAVLFGIVEQAARVLENGGMVIFETPNPENVLVGSHTFYHDFSHRNPVTPSAISFLFQYHGFSDIHIERLNPYPESAKVPGNDPLTERVNGHFCGPQDFAIIARK